MMSSMGHVVYEINSRHRKSHTGEKFHWVYSCSGGARMQEGDDFTADGEDFSRTQKHHEAGQLL